MFKWLKVRKIERNDSACLKAVRLTLLVLVIALLVLPPNVNAEIKYYNYSDSTNNKAFKKTTDNINIPFPWANGWDGAEVDAAEYTNLSTSNDARTITQSGATNNEPWLRFNFTMNMTEHPISNIDWVYVAIEYSVTSNGESCAFQIANFSGSAWQEISRTASATDVVGSSNYTSDFSQFISSGNQLVLAVSGVNIDSGEKCMADFIEVRVNYKEKQPPQWSNQSQGNNTIPQGSSNVLSVYWTDNIALGTALLSTNETGAWQNKTAYGSPLALSGAGAWSNFTWQNSSTPAGTTACWQVYANDTSNNWNVTPIKCFNITAALNKTVSTNKPSYNSCGRVFYKASLFNSNSQPVDSSITVSILDALGALQSYSSASTAGGFYLGAYKLPDSPTAGDWLIKVIAANVLAQQEFLVGGGNDEAWSIAVSLAPYKVLYKQGENVTLAYTVYSLKGIGIPGLWPSNTALYIDAARVTSGVVDEGGGSYSYEFNTSTLSANAAHAASVTAWTTGVNATSSISFYVVP